MDIFTEYESLTPNFLDLKTGSGIIICPFDTWRTE